MISIKESQLDFRIDRIETYAACCKCENETYSGDESGEAEAGLLSAQSEKKKSMQNLMRIRCYHN